MAENNSNQGSNTASWIKDLGFPDTDRIRVGQQTGFLGVTKPITIRIPDTMAATAANYTAPFFIAERPYEVLWCMERHETKGTDAGAVTVMLKKVPSGTATGSGIDILTAGISLKGTNNTNQEGIISQARTTAIYNRRLSTGDALSLVTTGTLTAVAGVTVSVLLRSL